MPAGEGILAYGVLFGYSEVGTTFTDLEDLDSIGEPGGLTAPDIDVTPITPPGSVRVFAKGLKVGDEFSFAQFYKKTRLTALRAIVDSNANYHWQLTFLDGGKLVWQGQLKSVKVGSIDDPDTPLVLNAAGKVNSNPVWMPGV